MQFVNYLTHSHTIHHTSSKTLYIQHQTYIIQKYKKQEKTHDSNHVKAQNIAYNGR